MYRAIKPTADNLNLIPPASEENLGSATGVSNYAHGSTGVYQYTTRKKGGGEKVDENEIKNDIEFRFMEMTTAGDMIGLIARSSGTKIICPIGVAYVRDTGTKVEIALYLKNVNNSNSFDSHVILHH